PEILAHRSSHRSDRVFRRVLFDRARDHFAFFNLDPGLVAARSGLDFRLVRDHSSKTKRLCAHGFDRCAASGAVMKSKESIETQVERLHTGGLIDMHFDLPMDLYEKRAQPHVLAAECLPEFEADVFGLVCAVIYIKD